MNNFGNHPSLDVQSIIIKHGRNIPGLVALYIFGSVAKAQQTPNSDIDIAFLAREPLANLRRWELAQEMALELKQDVDLIDLNACSEVMKFQIISTGKLIYSTNDNAVNAFADKTYWLYMDLKELTKGLYVDIQQRGSVYG